MSNISDFNVGDKIYKKNYETVDKNIVYEIIELWEEEGGNWHDGYQKLLYVELKGESKPYLLVNHVYGSGICIYGIKSI